MAKLTMVQTNRTIEREKRRLENLRKKREIQEKKELYGENWKYVEKVKLQREFEEVAGSDKCPKIYDFKDIYKYFNPLVLYKGKRGDVLKVDLNKFEESEKKFKQELAEIDALLEQQRKTELADKNEEEKDTEANIPLNDTQKEIKRQQEAVLNDGETSENDSVAFNITDKGIVELTAEQEEELDKKNSRVSDIILAKSEYNQIASVYFDRFLPQYNKYICSCCGGIKSPEEFYISYNIVNNGRIDERGNRRVFICKECTLKLFNWLYEEVCNKDIEEAMKRTCASLGLYWDSDTFKIAQKRFDDSDREGTLIGTYIKTANLVNPGKTFMDSPFLSEKYQTTTTVVNDETLGWDKEDSKNAKLVIKMVGYDPFEYESEKDRKHLYKDLLAILDAGMENDFTKLQAAIQIVQGFFKIRQLNEKISDLEKRGGAIEDISTLTELKKKEMTTVTNFAKDNQFATRYANAQAKGENTFTGIMNKMSEAKYEKALVNKYDIATSATIQQAADASFKAIFNQLSLGESEIWKITQQQFEELSKLRRELSKTQEDLRLSKYRESEAILKEKAVRKILKEHNLEDELA